MENQIRSKRHENQTCLIEPYKKVKKIVLFSFCSHKERIENLLEVLGRVRVA